MRIRTDEQARDVWKAFNARYENLASGIDDARKKHYQRDETNSQTLTPEQEEKGLLIKQRIKQAWDKAQSRDTLVRVNPHGNHTGTFNHFVNQRQIATHKATIARLTEEIKAVLATKPFTGKTEGERSHSREQLVEKTELLAKARISLQKAIVEHDVKKSINKTKLAQLQQALDAASLTDPIFLDDTLPQLALTLFDAEKISQQQFFTLLERKQAFTDFGSKGQYFILDENKKFTEEAEKTLLTALQNKPFIQPLSDEQIETFRLLVADLPRSEQVFYLTTVNEKDPHNEPTLKYKLARADAFNTIFTSAQSKVMPNRAFFIFPSHGAADALALSRFGNNYIRSMPRLGNQSINDIEGGVRKKARYAATAFPGTIAYKTIHNYNIKNTAAVNPTVASRHDGYHSDVMSSIPESFLQAIFRLVTISRENLEIQWSREIWEWIDCEYPYFRSPDNAVNNTKNNTALFCAFILYATTIGRPDRISGGSLVKFNSIKKINYLTPFGIFAFIDMIKNKEEWLKLGINPEQLTEPFNSYYKLIKKIYSHIENDESLIQALKCYCAIECDVSSKTGIKKFESINKIINENKNTIVVNCKFKKMLKADQQKSYYIKNAIFFEWDGESVFNLDLLSTLHSYLKLNYSVIEAEQYANNRKKGISKAASKYAIRPSLTNWIKVNPLKTLFACLTIVGIPFLLLHGTLEVKKSRAKIESLRVAAIKQPSSPMENVAAVDNSHSTIHSFLQENTEAFGIQTVPIRKQEIQTRKEKKAHLEWESEQRKLCAQFESLPPKASTSSAQIFAQANQAVNTPAEQSHTSAPPKILKSPG